MRGSTLSETRGFLKALVETRSDRILGFTAFGVSAAEIMTSVQIAMSAGVPYAMLHDTILTHPTLVEGLFPLFSSLTLGTFIVAMLVSLKSPSLGFVLICCALLLYLRPEPPGVGSEDAGEVPSSRASPPRCQQESIVR